MNAMTAPAPAPPPATAPAPPGYDVTVYDTTWRPSRVVEQAHVDSFQSARYKAWGACAGRYCRTADIFDTATGKRVAWVDRGQLVTVHGWTP